MKIIFVQVVFVSPYNIKRPENKKSRLIRQGQRTIDSRENILKGVGCGYRHE